MKSFNKKLILLLVLASLANVSAFAGESRTGESKSTNCGTISDNKTNSNSVEVVSDVKTGTAANGAGNEAKPK
jgi:hypothetical protein